MAYTHWQTQQLPPGSCFADPDNKVGSHLRPRHSSLSSGCEVAWAGSPRLQLLPASTPDCTVWKWTSDYSRLPTSLIRALRKSPLSCTGQSTTKHDIHVVKLDSFTLWREQSYSGSNSEDSIQLSEGLNHDSEEEVFEDPTALKETRRTLPACSPGGCGGNPDASQRFPGPSPSAYRTYLWSQGSLSIIGNQKMLPNSIRQHKNCRF